MFCVRAAEATTSEPECKSCREETQEMFKARAAHQERCGYNCLLSHAHDQEVVQNETGKYGTSTSTLLFAIFALSS